MFQKLVKIVPGGIPWNVLEKIPKIFEKLENSRRTATSVRKFRGKVFGFSLYVYAFVFMLYVNTT